MCTRHFAVAAVNKIQFLQSRSVCRGGGRWKPNKATSREVTDVTLDETREMKVSTAG